MNIRTLASMFGIETYEEENKQLHSDFDTLAKAYDQIKGANNVLAKQVIELEDKAQKVKEHEDYLVELIADYEEAKNKCEYMIDNLESLLKRAECRGINTGRASAYSELGIRRLDAIEDGNCLVMDKEGNVFELLQNLEDVTASNDNVNTVSTSEFEKRVEDYLGSEIEIDDLL